jgi:hypothetical protein
MVRKRTLASEAELLRGVFRMDRTAQFIGPLVLERILSKQILYETGPPEFEVFSGHQLNGPRRVIGLRHSVLLPPWPFAGTTEI